MAIYVTGDVHGRAEHGSSRFAFKNWPLGRTLTRDDAVIVAGDFGFVWDGSNAEKYWLDWLESKLGPHASWTATMRITRCWENCRCGSGTAGSSMRCDRTCCT